MTINGDICNLAILAIFSILFQMELKKSPTQYNYLYKEL